MTADESKGVIVWSEGSGISNQEIVQRLDFTVDASGGLSVGDPLTILPLAGEEVLPGEFLGYTVGDVWGDATHGLLYMSVSRHQQLNSGPNAGNNVNDSLIYDLNNLSARTIYHHLKPIGSQKPEVAEWLDAIAPMTLAECDSALYPQFVPTCYGSVLMTFNSSGTRLYLNHSLHGHLQDPGISWDSLMRIETDDMAAGKALADWDLAGPKLVLAVDQAAAGEVDAGRPRPDYDPFQLHSPEYIVVNQGEDSDYPTTEVVMILDADQCTTVHAPYANGMLAAPPDLWHECRDDSTFTFFSGSRPSGGWVWQSPEAMLKDSFQGRDTELFDIHRLYFSGALAGTEQLMIENSRVVDIGH